MTRLRITFTIYVEDVDKSGMRLTTFPSLAAWVRSLAKRGEFIQRGEGSRFPIAQ